MRVRASRHPLLENWDVLTRNSHVADVGSILPQDARLSCSCRF